MKRTNSSEVSGFREVIERSGAGPTPKQTRQRPLTVSLIHAVAGVVGEVGGGPIVKRVHKTFRRHAGIRHSDEAHLLDASAAELGHDALLVGPLLGRILIRLGAVEQLIRI
eukprot:CAMPEP_0201105606 /NCGR_PEP_ID=MMETSP0812-20130820/46870_1 /ASSEMBLY_ACC=CAM_ASM_000668 /TAXON_ID=98059 /ORGANISM="Dinobryon sp., Strain UTEXLB2267" /LENGTH=110 /DNA_ID=CAMNT_0047365555 /DNA_START=118 /DNA_END=450 /DNA_ORIENTATION=-